MNKEIAGPPNSREWTRCYRILRVGLLTLQAVKNARTQKYNDKIWALYEMFGELYWWIIAQADIKMRGEEMERILRRTLIEQAEAEVSGGSVKGFNPEEPWDYVWMLAALDRDFWYREVELKVALRATHLKGINVLASNGVLVLKSGGQVPSLKTTLVDSSEEEGRVGRSGRPP